MEVSHDSCSSTLLDESTTSFPGPMFPSDQPVFCQGGSLEYLVITLAMKHTIQKEI